MTRRDSFCRRRGLTQGAKNFKNTVLPAVNSIKLSGVKLGTSEAPATAKTESKEAAANFMVKKYSTYWILDMGTNGVFRTRTKSGKNKLGTKVMESFMFVRIHENMDPANCVCAPLPRSATQCLVSTHV